MQASYYVSYLFYRAVFTFNKVRFSPQKADLFNKGS